MSTNLLLGKKIRSARRAQGLTQARLAEDLGISASYLNLIENEKRPITAELLLKVAAALHLDLQSLASSDVSGLTDDLLEVFGDPVFEDQRLTGPDVREFARTQPDVARAVLELFQAYSSTRQSVAALSESVHDRQEFGGVDRTQLSSEQVSDLLQKHNNHFPVLEEAAERIWRDGKLEGEDLFAGLEKFLQERHGVLTEILHVDQLNGAVRSFDRSSRKLALSEVLRRGSRNFQLAHQLAYLETSSEINQIVSDPVLTSDESRALGRVALANYFASAVLMPYKETLAAAVETRYDIDLMGHRFRVSYEQVCHRLTSLRRRGQQGVPFDFVRVDIAGNISKKFSGAGVRLPRFSGLCPLWNVHAAFLQPGRIRVQLSQLSDGTRFFSIARTVRKHRGGFHAPNVLHAIALGCDIESARKLVYADGIDLESRGAAVPVGVTCRLCDRINCEARAFPSLQRPLKVDENVRGVSFYTPIED